jgi:mercuric reductase
MGLMWLPELPAAILVLGAAYIGVELAQLFSRAGAAVTLVSRRGVLPEAEPEVAAAPEGYLAEEGARLERVEGYESVAQAGAPCA